jgi:hypothetical protein
MAFDEMLYVRRALLTALRDVRNSQSRGELDRAQGYLLGMQHGLLMAAKISDDESGRLCALGNNAARQSAKLISDNDYREFKRDN